MAEEKLPVEQDEELAQSLITLEDESGAEHVFEAIDQLEHVGKTYFALVPYQEEEPAEDEELELLIMRVGEDEQGEFFDIVDDDDELYEVGQLFETRLAEFFDVE